MMHKTRHDNNAGNAFISTTFLFLFQISSQRWLYRCSSAYKSDTKPHNKYLFGLKLIYIWLIAKSQAKSNLN